MTRNEFMVQHWVLQASLTIAACVEQLNVAIELLEESGGNTEARVLVAGVRRTLKERIEDVPQLSEEYARVADAYVESIEAAKGQHD